ncbi:MAG: ATP-binding protein, partial [Mycobacterium leprae]
RRAGSGTSRCGRVPWLPMDLFLDRTRPEAVSELRRQVGGFLERHGTDAEAARTGELVVGELLANAFEHSEGDVWVSVDWTGERPVVAVHDLGPASRSGRAFPRARPRAGGGCTWSRAWPGSCGRRRRRRAARW